MKKVLLAGTALLGFAAISTPALAEVNLELGGYFRGYGVYTDNDEPAGASLREFDFRRDTEIHFNGETTTDNGLTIGFHYEQAIGGAVTADEAYSYVSSGFGRVNFGSEDGAAYLLQVAAPSADSNVDGMRAYINAIEADFFDGADDGDFAGEVLEYDHADFEDTDRLTYLSPKWNGFQAGVSYAPEQDQNVVGDNLSAAHADNTVGEFEDLWEVAARWDGEFEGFGISFGGGYSSASTEADAAVGLAGSDDIDTYNVGLNVAFSGFSVGTAYNSTNNGVDAGGDDEDTDTWVVGGAYDNGPYHLGASYLNREYGEGVVGVGADEVEVERFTFGGGYTYGPGATFRGAIAFGDAENGTGTEPDFVQATVGTDVQF